MVKLYTGSNLSNEEIVHGFFSRQGGVSEGVYTSLNCGTGSNDNQDYIKENRKRVMEEQNAQHLLSVYQVHGSRVVNVEDPWADQDHPEADALVTDKVGVALGILTADCAPVLFYGVKPNGAPVVGAAHAGWQGALSGVLESTIKALQNLGAPLESIRACIGPCISKASYEVDLEFVKRFVEHKDESERFFHPAAKEERAMFDLAGYCAWRLSSGGVRDIGILDMDTYKNEEDFFSYRRTTHRGEQDYGRQISSICIK